MLERDFVRDALAILREHTDAWQKVGPLGYALSLRSGHIAVTIKVYPRLVYVPEPPRGSYTAPIWTTEAEGLDKAFRMLGPTALEALRLQVPDIAARLRAGDPRAF